MMLSRLAVALFLLSACGVPAFAQGSVDICALHVDLTPVETSAEAKAGAAPADVSFGLYPMSVLGIANTLRRDGAAIDETSDRSALTTGPLACVVDSLRAWERSYPADPWIAKDLLTLEVVYLRAHGSDARELAARAEAWLAHDYPLSNYLEPARLALGNVNEAKSAVENAVAQREPAVTRREAVVAQRSEPGEAFPVARVQAAAPLPFVYLPAPIALAAAPVPPPAALPASIPSIKTLASPWERFASLAVNHP